MSIELATVRFASIAKIRRSDMSALRKMAGPSRKHEAGQVLQVSGAPNGPLLLLLDGWAQSSVVLASGARQILRLHVAGDLLGLQSLAFTKTVDTIAALTPVTVCDVTPESLGRLFADNPRLAALLFLISQQERALLVDQLTLLGRAETSQRIAALLVQLHQRLSLNNPTLGLAFRVPLTQAHIGDMVGATPVHVSRVFQDLAAEGLVVWTRGTIRVENYQALLERAGLPNRELVQDPTWIPAKST